MKKVFSLIAISLFVIAVFTTSCDKDNPVSCAEKLVALSNAQTAYILDDSYENCIAYKNALEDYINCDGITDKAIYQGYLDDLTCTP